jgi:transposase-like protein
MSHLLRKPPKLSKDATDKFKAHMNKDRYICNNCNSTFTIDFYRCPECCKGYITLNN